MRITYRFLLALGLSLIMCFAFAQGGGGGQRRGGFRNNNSIVGLLNRPDVQSELNLTDDEKTKLSDLRQQMRAGFTQGQRPTPEEMQARNAEMEKNVQGILTPAQWQRLTELQIQRMGDEAIGLPRVQAALNLSDDQKAKIKSIQDTYMEANRSVGEKMRNGEIDADAARTARQKNSETLKQDLHNVLTPDQISKLHDLGGKPFTFSEGSNGGGGGRGGR